MPELGKKYNCYSCHTKFYDLGKAVPTCPKCGADQRDSEEKPLITSHRGRRVVEEPVEEPELPEPEAAAPEGDEDEEVVPETPEREAEEEDQDEEEEDY